MRIGRSHALVLGHRGYRAKFPENTLLAFREALAAGADGIECDLQKSADGRYVVIHDPRTGRVAAADLDVHRSGLEELLALDFGRGEKMATLEEMLGSLPSGTYLDLELKEETLREEDCEPIMKIVDSAFPRASLMISSFDPRLLVPFRARGYTVGFLVGEEAAGQGLWAFAMTLLRLRPQYVNFPIDMIRTIGMRRSVWLVRLLRLLGFSLLFWTVNTPEDALFASRHGRIIVTDEVETIIAVVKRGFIAN